MKYLLFSTCIIMLLCSYYPVEKEEPYYVPVLMTREVLESSIELLPARELDNPGKIYLVDDYIFINERYKGMHPLNIHFIRIPGCIDMAVKGQTLYADNAVDLVAVDLSDINNITVTSRIRNVFPEILAPDGTHYWSYYNINRPENTIIVGWETK
jgi:hypothetical protein